MVNYEAQRIRNEIVGDMNKIIGILKLQASYCRMQKGVGCEFCADKLEEIALRYKDNIKKLNQIN